MNNGFLKDYFRKNGQLMGWALLIAVGFWVVVLIILPQISMLDFSFRNHLPPPEMGGPKDVYTLKNYQYLIFGAEKQSRGLQPRRPDGLYSYSCRSRLCDHH